MTSTDTENLNALMPHVNVVSPGATPRFYGCFNLEWIGNRLRCNRINSQEMTSHDQAISKIV